MKAEWVKAILKLSSRKADFYSGNRKIFQGDSILFKDLWDYDDPLVLEDAGYTKSKMSHLVRLYLHEESRDMALKLWKERRKKTTYGSVSFSCYNHLLKNDPTKKSKRASVMGPCIQAVSITQIKGNNSKGTGGSYSIDCFYRTTELLKKFPADLVFIRDVLLKDFDFSGMEFVGMRCHFANITVHPAYFATVLPHLDDPIEELDKIKERDKYFFDWVVKWTARYLVPEHFRGIEKHAQSLRVKMDVDKRITGKIRKKLIKYLEKNHPGHRGDYAAPEGEE